MHSEVALPWALRRPQPELWAAPWWQGLWPLLCTLGEVLEQDADRADRPWTLADALNAALLQLGVEARVPVRFAPQAALPQGRAYESFVFQQRLVPTRDNWHDAFNALMWWRWPLLKTQINRLQAEQIQDRGVAERRGALRDALTLLDESGAILLAPSVLCEALAARDWRRLFVQERALWSQARLHIVGHALLEKLRRPYKAVTAHVLCLPQGHAHSLVQASDRNAESTSTVPDAEIAQLCSADFLRRKPFLPLPVMGLPGWCDDNQHPNFYDDAQVFRSMRRPSQS